MPYLEIKKDNQPAVFAGGRGISLIALSLIGSVRSPIVSVSATGIDDTAGERNRQAYWLRTTLESDERIEFVPRKITTCTPENWATNSMMKWLDRATDRFSVEKIGQRSSPGHSALCFIITVADENPVVACIGDQEQLQIVCAWLKDKTNFRLTVENVTAATNGTAEGQLLYERQLKWDQPVQVVVRR